MRSISERCARVGCERPQCPAYRIEERRGIEPEANMVDEACDAPACSLRGHGLADPAQHFLGAIGCRGGEATGFQFGEGEALIVGEVALPSLEHRPADGFGQLAVAMMGARDEIPSIRATTSLLVISSSRLFPHLGRMSRLNTRSVSRQLFCFGFAYFSTYSSVTSFKVVQGACLARARPAAGSL